MRVEGDIGSPIHIWRIAMNDNGNQRRAWTLNSLIEAMTEAMPNATISVINKLAPRPLIFIDSGMYLGDSIDDGTDHHLHDLKPEMSLPLVDDGGPTPEDMGLELGGEDELDQLIKRLVASGVPTDNIDKPVPEEEMPREQRTLTSEVQRLKSLMGKGIISEEECERDISVMRKARDLHNAELIGDEEFQHALSKHHLLLPDEVPTPEDLTRDDDPEHDPIGDAETDLNIFTGKD
jgi:hypothetical protein